VSSEESKPLVEIEACPSDLMCEVWRKVIELIQRAVARDISYEALGECIKIVERSTVDLK